VVAIRGDGAAHGSATAADVERLQRPTDLTTRGSRAARGRPLLRLCADSIARKTYALEQLATAPRSEPGPVYKALRRSRRSAPFFSELALTRDTVDDGNWEDLQARGAAAVDTVREPDDDDDRDETQRRRPPTRNRPRARRVPAKH